MTWQNPVALPTVPSLLAACLVLVVGALLTRNVSLLARYNIPVPIVRGLLCDLPQRRVGLITHMALAKALPGLLTEAAVAVRGLRRPAAAR